MPEAGMGCKARSRNEDNVSAAIKAQIYHPACPVIKRSRIKRNVSQLLDFCTVLEEPDKGAVTLLRITGAALLLAGRGEPGF